MSRKAESPQTVPAASILGNKSPNRRIHRLRPARNDDAYAPASKLSTAVVRCLPLRAAIVTHDHGGTETGQIGEIVGSEFQFFGERYVILKIDRLRDIDVDRQLDGAALEKDEANVARILLMLDKAKPEVKDLSERVRQWLQNEDYDSLQNEAHRLAAEETRLQDGSWAIEDFYDAFTDDLGKRAISDFNARLQQVESWAQARPQSAVAKIALIEALTDTAWAYRGGGYSRTVTENNHQKFRELLQRAAQITEAVSSSGVKNPVLYQNAIILMNALGAGKDILKQIAMQSNRDYPGYYPSYTSAYVGLMRKWGGRPGEVQAFIKQISKTVRDSQPEIMFLAHRRIYSNFEPREYADMHFDWQNIRHGFENYRQKYHANDADYHLMAMLACLHDDKAAAREYFAATSGSWNPLTKRIWRKQEKLDSYRAWTEKETPPYYDQIREALSKNDIPVLTELVRSNPELLKIFLHRDLYGDTMLHELVNRNDTEMLQLLASLGVSLESRNDYGYTPLHWAAHLGRSESAAALVALGADIRSRKEGKKADHAAHLAAKNGFYSILAILHRQDPEIIALPNNNQTRPLHYAAWNGHLDTVKFILDREPGEIDRQDVYRYTPLHYAIDRGHLDIVELLADRGAATGLKNKAGYTPLSFARKKNFAAIEEFLHARGAEDSQVEPESDQLKRAQEIYAESNQYFNQQDYRKAIEIYEKTLEVYPDYYLPYAALAQVAFDFEKDFEKADRYYDKSIELNPGYAENYYWKARTNYQLGKPEIYRPLFQKYVEMAPDTYNAIDLKKNRPYLLEEESAIPLPPAVFVRYQVPLFAGLIVLLVGLLSYRMLRRG